MHPTALSPRLTKLDLLLSIFALTLLTVPATGRAADPSPAPAQPIAKGFLDRTHMGADGKASKYVVFVPDSYHGSSPVPAILFLHGAGERGTDGHRQVEVGLGPFIRVFQKRFPFLVVFPQAERTWRADSPDGQRALAILDEVQKEFKIDPDRVILTGLSMGGFGTWSMAAKDPKRFAAIVPVCGGPRPPSAARAGGESIEPSVLKDIPTWIFQGSDDPVVRAEWARQMVESLKKAGGRPRYSEFPHVGHDSWNPAYATWELYEWLSQQRRGTAARPESSKGTPPAATPAIKPNPPAGTKGADLKPSTSTGRAPVKLVQGLGSHTS